MKIISDLFSKKSRSASLGICLSGGGALGFAHIGVLQALEEHNIFPTHLVGTSMGAIVGALYAAGNSPAHMLQMIKDNKLNKVTKLMTFRPTLMRSGLSSHDMLRSLIHELIPHNSFEQLSRQLAVCVVNLNTGEWEIVSAGNELDKWIAASASIPGVFETIQVGNAFYVDGGVLNNMPAQGISELCSTIIGVDVLPHKAPKGLNKPSDTMAYAIRAMQHQNSKAGRSLCRFIIEPQAINRFHEFSFDAYQAIYEYGYTATTAFIAQNPDILALQDEK